MPLGCGFNGRTLLLVLCGAQRGYPDMASLMLERRQLFSADASLRTSLVSQRSSSLGRGGRMSGTEPMFGASRGMDNFFLQTESMSNEEVL